MLLEKFAQTFVGIQDVIDQPVVEKGQQFLSRYQTAVAQAVTQGDDLLLEAAMFLAVPCLFFAR